MQSMVLLPATAALTALLASAFGLVSYGTTRAGMVGWYRWQHRPTSLGVEEKIRCGSRKVRAHWGIVYHVVGRPCHINSCFCKLAQRQGYLWYHTYIPYHLFMSTLYFTKVLHRQEKKMETDLSCRRHEHMQLLQHHPRCRGVFRTRGCHLPAPPPR